MENEKLAIVVHGVNTRSKEDFQDGVGRPFRLKSV